VPKGVRVDIPLQAYFRINAENMGQFPIARELPMEYALELNRLIELQMEGAVG
jgi:Fe-S cluster assembly scaffold protein SufB